MGEDDRKVRHGMGADGTQGEFCAIVSAGQWDLTEDGKWAWQSDYRFGGSVSLRRCVWVRHRLGLGRGSPASERLEEPVCTRNKTLVGWGAMPPAWGCYMAGRRFLAWWLRRCRTFCPSGLRFNPCTHTCARRYGINDVAGTHAGAMPARVAIRARSRGGRAWSCPRTNSGRRVAQRCRAQRIRRALCPQVGSQDSPFSSAQSVGARRRQLLRSGRRSVARPTEVTSYRGPSDCIEQLGAAVISSSLSSRSAAFAPPEGSYETRERCRRAVMCAVLARALLGK